MVGKLKISVRITLHNDAIVEVPSPPRRPLMLNLDNALQRKREQLRPVVVPECTIVHQQPAIGHESAEELMRHLELLVAPYQIPSSEIHVDPTTAVLGGGIYATVFRAVRQTEGSRQEEVAIKEFRFQRSDLPPANIINTFRNEVEMLLRLNGEFKHPQLVQFRGVIVTHTRLAIITELCNRGRYVQTRY